MRHALRYCSLGGSIVGAGVLLCLLFVRPSCLQADIVHLTNGRTLEGIVISESEDQVRLRLPYGEIGLARVSVARIDRQVSAFEEFVERRSELRDRQASADAWLELARWARARDLDYGAREAAVEAARRQPDLPELSPFMREAGFAYDEESREWLRPDDLMRRRGYLWIDGRWLSPEVALAEQEARAAARAEQKLVQREERMTRLMEMMVWTQMVEATESRRQREELANRPQGIPVYGYPVAVWPGYWPSPVVAPRPHRPGSHRSEARARYSGIVSRAPGSWIPVPPEANRGGIREAGRRP